MQEHYARAKCIHLIHLIVDNYRIHKSKAVDKYLAKPGCRIRLHFLPPYCPDDNRIEREWPPRRDRLPHQCAMKQRRNR